MNNILKFLPAIAAISIAGIVFLCSGNKPDVVRVEESEPEIPGDGTDAGSEPADLQQDGIFVYVSGCVMSPGVYYLPRGSRVFEAVDMAGGLTENADVYLLNLAQEVLDGQHIYVPDALEAENGFPEDMSSSYEYDGRININTASVEQLQALPGIGISKAQAIVEYREHSLFSCIEDIMNVTGIKEGSFEKIKDKIKV